MLSHAMEWFRSPSLTIGPLDLGLQVPGSRQRLTRERVPELTEATRQLDKLETVTSQVRDCC